MSAFFSKKYMWRDGYGYGGKEKAQIVGEVLEHIENRDGEVTSKSFLEESRPENSPTHSMFEWDDNIAAEKYRLNQSSKIIGQLTFEIIYEQNETTELEIEVKKENTESVEAPITLTPHSAFVNCSSSKMYGSPSSDFAKYVSINKAMSNTDMREQVVANSFREMKMFINKYREITEFAKIFAAMDEVEAELNNTSNIE